MLESMCQNSRPTRAEASDVYNAVLDGADAVMLSGESSVGKYPVEAVRTMDEIVCVAQQHMPKRNPKDYDSSVQRVTETMAHAAYTVSDEFKSVDYEGKIIVITRSGKAARLISKFRPSLPILAFSESLRTVRELTLVWGVRSHFIPEILGLTLEDQVIKAKSRFSHFFFSFSHGQIIPKFSNISWIQVHRPTPRLRWLGSHHLPNMVNLQLPP